MKGAIVMFDETCRALQELREWLSDVEELLIETDDAPKNYLRRTSYYVENARVKAEEENEYFGPRWDALLQKMDELEAQFIHDFDKEGAHAMIDTISEADALIKDILFAYDAVNEYLYLFFPQ